MAAIGAMEDLVSDRLSRLGWEVRKQQVRRAARPGTVGGGPIWRTHNLIASQGLAVTGPMRILGAHLDTVATTPGADDDGSGVATLLEVARLLTPDARSRVELCFFNEEEDGLLGSSTFVEEMKGEDRARVRGALMVDMVGAFDEQRGTQTYPEPFSWFRSGRGDFLALVASRGFDEDRRLLEALRPNLAPHVTLQVLEPHPYVADQIPDMWRGDHVPFWLAEIPAAVLTDTANFRRAQDYHSPSDQADRLDYRRMAELTDLLVAWATSG